jgi:hypothetical protein
MKDAKAMLKDLAHERRVPSPSHWPSWFVLSAGGILALAGASRVMDALQTTQVLDLPDPLSGLPFRYLLLSVGVAELVVAWLCLFTNRRGLALGLVSWLAINWVVYRVGLWTMGWPHPWVYVDDLTDWLRVSPLLADGILLATALYLVIGSAVLLLLPASKLAVLPERVDGFKMSCPACGVHIEFAVQNLGQKIPCPHCRAAVTLRKPDLLKTVCFFCKEHIEFPPHAIGTKIPCPHCKMDITLKEPA